MTVSNTTSVVQYSGNGVTVAWPTGFRFFKNTDLVVIKRSAAGGSTLLALNVDYSVSGANSVNGGTVNTTNPLLGGATPDFLTIARVLTVQQLTDLRNQGNYFAEIHEDVFDYLTMLIQQTGESDSRALRHPRDSEHYQAEARRIVNMEDPQDPQDATTKNWVSSYFANLIDQATGLINTTIGILYDSGTLFDYLRFGVNRTVDSIAALRLLSGARNQRAFVLGYYANGDGGGGAYFLDTTDTTSADNGGTIIVGGDGGRWKLCGSALVTIRQFGAKGDGVTNDTSAIQAGLNWAIGVNRQLFAPAGTYRITSGLVMDYTNVFYASSQYAKKAHFVGEGAVCTNIQADAGSYAAFSFVGNTLNNTAYFTLRGIRFTGTGRAAGSVGVVFNRAAFVRVEDVIAESFAIGLQATDLEQVSFYDCIFRFNTSGIQGGTGSMTGPNSWSLYNVTVANNTKAGVTIQNANALNWNGGSIQYNGFIGGDATNFGMQLIECGTGYGTIGLSNFIFEGNGGLGDLVSGQGTNPCDFDIRNVSFLRTIGFYSATVLGAANNGSGAIRLTLNSSAVLTGLPKVAIWGVGGTTEANNAIPWSFTIVDSTHIDLVGSTFTNAYTSGGWVSVVGFGTNNIVIGGAATNCTYALSGCTFEYAAGYTPSASRPTIAISNINAMIADNGTNYFQSATEKLTYTQSAQIGDDGSSWAPFASTASAAGGTYTATVIGRIKKIGKTVAFQAEVTTTSFTAPTAPLTITLPFVAASSCQVSALNGATLITGSGLISAGLTTCRMWTNGAFPVTANGQKMFVGGFYESQ